MISPGGILRQCMAPVRLAIANVHKPKNQRALVEKAGRLHTRPPEGKVDTLTPKQTFSIPIATFKGVIDEYICK